MQVRRARSDGESVELKDYWLTIRRRWVLVLLTFVIVLGGAAAFTALSTPLYASDVKLYVSTQSQDLQAAHQGGMFASQQMASYAEIAGYSQHRRRGRGLPRRGQSRPASAWQGSVAGARCRPTPST